MTPSEEIKPLICLKCSLPMETRKVYFNYLGFKFNTDLPCCSRCGQIYLSEELVRTKVREVETSLEDK